MSVKCLCGSDGFGCSSGSVLLGLRGDKVIGEAFIIDFKGSFEYFIIISCECGMLRVFVVY